VPVVAPGLLMFYHCLAAESALPRCSVVELDAAYVGMDRQLACSSLDTPADGTCRASDMHSTSLDFAVRVTTRIKCKSRSQSPYIYLAVFAAGMLMARGML
jgi:hypothetical protein